MSWKTPFVFLRDLVFNAIGDNVPMLAAGLAFYSLISVAPVLVIGIAIAGLVFGQEVAQSQVVAELGELIGEEGAATVEEMIRRSSRPGAGITATVLGLLVLMFGAARLFDGLQVALNTIWGLKMKERPGLVKGFVGTLRDRFFTILMVLGTGFLLLVSLLISAALTAVTTYFQGLLPGLDTLWRWANALIGFGITTLIFTAILQGVPDVTLRWRDVVLGGAFTALLFAVGRYLMGMYLGGGSFGTVYGAAASLVIFLFWVYYTAQILCFGAEFTKLYVQRRKLPVSLRRRAEFKPVGEG